MGYITGKALLKGQTDMHLHLSQVTRGNNVTVQLSLTPDLTPIQVYCLQGLVFFVPLTTPFPSAIPILQTQPFQEVAI